MIVRIRNNQQGFENKTFKKDQFIGPEDYFYRLLRKLQSWLAVLFLES